MKPRRKLFKWFFLGVVALLIMAIALAGCGPEEVAPPAEEAAGGVGAPAEEAVGEVAPPGEEEAVGGVAPAEEEAVGGVAPQEEEAVGGVAPPEEEAAGGTAPPEEEAAGEAAPPPSPEAVSVDIELEVDSTNPEGVKFVAPESGSYKITIVGGAYCYLSEEEEAWPIYGGWLTMLSLYINRPVEWGAPDEWGQHAINSDNIIGSEERYPTFAEAEATGQGLSVTVDLDKNGYVIVIVSDGSDYYFDNSGIIRINITGP